MKMINNFKLIFNSISHKLYKQHRKYIFDIYSNYKQILDIRSKYDGNDILREPKLFLHRLSIEERMNDLNYYCEYDNDNQIINDAPFFSNIDDIRVVRHVARCKTKAWLEKLLNDILEYENDLIIRLNVDVNDFEG